MSGNQDKALKASSKLNQNLSAKDMKEKAVEETVPAHTAKHASHASGGFPMGNKRRHKMRVIFTKQTRERKLFMEELKEIRVEKDRVVFHDIKRNIGPTWYQVLSTRHRRALDSLELTILRDLLQATTDGTMAILRTLGLSPLPHVVDVFNSLDISGGNPMLFFSRLFYIIYDHEISSKRYQYDLNSRVILSSIFYLGLRDLKRLLTMKFAPDREIPPTPPPVVKKLKPCREHPSPYMCKMIAPMWLPAEPKKKKPAPLPDLGWLNALYETEPTIPRPPPPPPPPPPPKKRLGLEYCMELAGYKPILPPTREPQIITVEEVPKSKKRRRPSKMTLKLEKKVYGLDKSVCLSKRKKKLKLLIPHSPIENEQYNIIGIYSHGKFTCAVVGGLVRMALKGLVIHGGHAKAEGGYIMINKGIVSEIPPKQIPPCTCLESLEQSAMKYVFKHKCICHHRYDFKNEGDFDNEDDEEPFFQKPTAGAPFVFRLDNIYQTNPHVSVVKKAINDIWEEDSVLNIEEDIDPHDTVALNKAANRKKKKNRKVFKPVEPTCLGDIPKIEDYLRCALRQFRLINIAARLPDVHKTRELREWMRMRLYGPMTREEKQKINFKSTKDWMHLKSFEQQGLGVPKIKYPDYLKLNVMTNWAYKTDVIQRFQRFTNEYRTEIYKKHAYMNNVLWSTMCHPEFPDKQYREIYFSYMISQVNDVVIWHPFSPRDCMGRRSECLKKQYVCLPKGASDLMGKF